MNENVFNDYSDFYDIFYKDKDYACEVNYLSNLLKNIIFIKKLIHKIKTIIKPIQKKYHLMFT